DGRSTTPALYCFDVSGPRLRLPPVAVSGVIAAQPEIVESTRPAVQVVGSKRELPGLGEIVTPLKSWLKVGTRKPVLYEPRNISQSNGMNLAVIFGFVVVPMPV